jgi:ATP-dependent protease ClpP protease subunit
MVALQGADHRIGRPHARLLVHEVRRWSWGVERQSDAEDELQGLQAVAYEIVAIIASRASRSPDDVRSLFRRRDVWLSATQALEFGLIDEIG